MYDDLDQLDGCLHSDSFLQPADQKSDLHWVGRRDVGEEVILPPPGMFGPSDLLWTFVNSVTDCDKLSWVVVLQIY